MFIKYSIPNLLLSGRENMGFLIGCGYFRCTFRANDSRNLQHIIFCVQNGHCHWVLATIARILVGFLHQIDHLRIEIRPRWRLIHNQMTNSLQPCTPEKMCPLRIEHEVCAAVEEHWAGTIDFSFLYKKRMTVLNINNSSIVDCSQEITSLPLCIHIFAQN